MSKYREDLERRIREARPLTTEEASERLTEIRREMERLNRESANIMVRRADGLAPEEE